LDHEMAASGIIHEDRRSLKTMACTGPGAMA
jgi:hypothetical protein